MLLYCGCKSDDRGNKFGAVYQDMTYSEGHRVHTPTAKENNFRCTICLKERGKAIKESPKDKKSEEKSKKDRGKVGA